MKSVKRFALVWMIAFISAIVKWSDVEWLNNPVILIIGFALTTITYGVLDIFGGE